MPKAPPSLFRNCAPEYVAVVLASSTGSRMFPLTSTEFPKHMMPVGGIPVISRLLAAIEASGFQECVVVLAHDDDKVTIPHLKSDLLMKDESDSSYSNNNDNNMGSSFLSMRGTYQVTSSRPNHLVLESSTHMKLTVITLSDDCQGSIDALRRVEELAAVPIGSNMVVLPGDLVVLDSSIISNLCNTHRQGHQIMTTACTVLLVDVGEQDEHGAPLKESAKQKKGCLARDEEDIEYIALSYSSAAASAPRLVWKQSKIDVHDNESMVAETPKLKLPKPRLRVGCVTRVRTDWNDVHVYVLSPWVRRLAMERKSLLTIQEDLLPLLISRQFQGIKAAFGSQIQEEILDEVLATSPDLTTTDLAAPVDNGDNLAANPTTKLSLTAPNEFAVLAYVQDDAVSAVRAHTVSSFLHVSREILALASSEDGGSKTNPCLQLPPNTCLRSKFHSILLPGATVGDKVTFKSSSVGRNCKLGAKCRLNNVVIMDNVTVGENVTLQNSIIGSNVIVGDNCSLNDCQVASGKEVPAGDKAKGETFS